MGSSCCEESYLKGSVVGASLRGKIDFKTRKMNLGGTYIPLSGLNSAFGAIPLFGPLISGVRGDGIFGVTFAVQGSFSDPQVIVNPLSMVAPGIFRDLFQMTSDNPQVQVREEKAPAKSRGRARAREQHAGRRRKPQTRSAKA